MSATTRRLLIAFLGSLADDLEAEQQDFAARVRAALRRYRDADCSTAKGVGP
jgi:hypothetical protein